MVEYLPDRNGKISKCGAQDPTHCRYHVGPDGRPLKHYHTAEEARKAYEASLKNNNKSTGLKKKSRIAVRLEDGFLPEEYRGLSLKQIDNRLDRLARQCAEKAEALDRKSDSALARKDELYNRLYGKLQDEASTKELVRKANVHIWNYREQVRNALKAIDDKIDWCDGDTRRSRMVLNQLGVDYGSLDGVEIQAKAKECLESSRPDVDPDGIRFVVFDEDKNSQDYDSVIKELGGTEDMVNTSLHKLKGVKGLTSEVKVDDLTQPGNQSYSDYRKHETRKLMRKHEEDHPETYKEYQEASETMRKLSEECSDYLTLGEDAESLKEFLPNLRNVRSVDDSESGRIVDGLSKKATEEHDNGFKDRLGSMTVLGVDDGGSGKRYLVKRHYSKTDLEMALGKPNDKFIIDDNGKVLATWPQCRSFWEWSNL